MRCCAQAEPALPAHQRYSILWASRAEYSPGGPTAYSDSALDRLAVGLLTRRLAAQLGQPLGAGAACDYAAFVEVAWALQRGRSAPQQHAFVVSALLSLLPLWLWAALRRLVEVLTWLRFPVGGALAFAAVPFAGWLVGPAHVEFRPHTGAAGGAGSAAAAAAGAAVATTVLRRCRYLEASGCKSACVNVCKAPTQAFFADVLGVPLTMTPDFETLSCELKWGVQPPPLHLDEAMRGACFSTCDLAKRRAEGGADDDAAAGCSPPASLSAASIY